MTDTEPAPGSAQDQAPKTPVAALDAVPEAPEAQLSRWGRRAARIYLAACALALIAMLVETLLGHPGTGSMFAAILAAPWSMLVAGLAPQLPRDWPLAAGLAVRMVPLALFMLLNAAIVRGIAARTERDLTRTASRVSALTVLSALLGSGCMLASRQAVFVAAPADSFLFFTGGKQEMVFTFDLSTNPQWVDQHAEIADVTELAILGDFRNATGGMGGIRVPIDVRVAASADRLPTFTSIEDVWGPVHLDTLAVKRVDWTEGEHLMLPDASMLENEVRGDGRFTLLTVTTPQITLNGGVSIENLRLAAVFDLK